MALIIPLNKKNKNNRSYSPDNFQKFVDTKESFPGYHTNIALPYDISSDTLCCAVSNLSIENDNLYADIQWLKNYEDIKETLAVTPIGAGLLSDDGKISDYELTGFNVYLKEESAFYGI